MSKELAVRPKELPTIEELYSNKELAIKESYLQILLNNQPKTAWVKKHPIYGNQYIPIEVQEWLLTSIFGRWWVEIKEVKQVLNSAVVTVRLHVINPTTNEVIWQDGTGAHNFQLDSGAASDDFSKMKNNAVMLAVPIAESRAFSDAADKFGKIFGKDLNRKNTMNYDKIAEKFKAKPELLPNSQDWADAKLSLEFNNTTIEQIKKHFTLTAENENILCSK
jgi:hypothetical protein